MSLTCIYIYYTHTICVHVCIYGGVDIGVLQLVHYAYCTALVSPSLLRHLMCVVG